MPKAVISDNLLPCTLTISSYLIMPLCKDTAVNLPLLRFRPWIPEKHNISLITHFRLSYHIRPRATKVIVKSDLWNRHRRTVFCFWIEHHNFSSPYLACSCILSNFQFCTCTSTFVIILWQINENTSSSSRLRMTTVCNSEQERSLVSEA